MISRIAPVTAGAILFVTAPEGKACPALIPCYDGDIRVALNATGGAACALCGAAGQVVQQYAGYQLDWCSHCDFAFVTPPMPAADHLAWHGRDFFVRYYGEDIETFYSRKGPLYWRERRKKRWMLDFLARYVPRGRILDVGTGQGMFSYMALEDGYEVEATEVCPMDVAYHQTHGLRVHDRYLEDADLPENAFDAVTMWHSLEHVLDPIATLNEVRRVLRPGGYLVGALPNWRGLGTQLRLLLKHPLFDPQTDHELHFFHYSRKALCHAMRVAGLTPLYIGRERHQPRRLRDRLIALCGEILSLVPGLHCRETMTMVGRKPS